MTDTPQYMKDIAGVSNLEYREKIKELEKENKALRVMCKVYRATIHRYIGYNWELSRLNIKAEQKIDELNEVIYRLCQPWYKKLWNYLRS